MGAAGRYIMSSSTFGHPFEAIESKRKQCRYTHVFCLAAVCACFLQFSSPV